MEGNLTMRAYAFLKERIQNCDYMPGEPLYEKLICEMLSCGRTPVREALLALRNEGLVDIYPRRGMCVHPITREYVDEIYQVRKLLEPAMAVKYCHLYDKKALMEHDRELSRMEDLTQQEYYSSDVRFHEYLMGVTGNHTLIAFYARLMQGQYRLGMYSARLKTAIWDDAYTQHHAIITAILHEDAPQIEHTILAHANYSHVIALKTLEVSI